MLLNAQRDLGLPLLQFTRFFVVFVLRNSPFTMGGDARCSSSARGNAAGQSATPLPGARAHREPSRIEKSVIRLLRLFLLGYVPASGTTDLAVRFDSKTNGTGTLRQFVSKATRPKLPGGLLLSPVCLSCLVQRTAERPASGERRITSCTARRARPSYRASWSLNRFPSPLNTARMTTCGYRDGSGRHLLNAPPWR
jgi:hypothetical protein